MHESITIGMALHTRHLESTKEKKMVLIENMEKPKDCESCPLCDYDGDCVLIPDGNQKETFKEQYLACPLREVQE